MPWSSDTELEGLGRSIDIVLAGSFLVPVMLCGMRNPPLSVRNRENLDPKLSNEFRYSMRTAMRCNYGD